MTRSCFGDLGGLKSCWGYRLKLVSARNSKQGNELNNNILNRNLRLFSMEELQKATNSFSTNLGQCEFLSYYKGTLENGTEVMIKVILHSEKGAYRKQEWDIVLSIRKLSRIRHRNVAEILGCCVENDRLIMVFEFIGDYCLDQLLFIKELAERSELSWSIRASICIGIARGLEYLHEGSRHCVVQCDIKPINIILDNNFNPKIVDYGLAQLFDDDDDVSHHSGVVTGTTGYMAPECYLGGTYTAKADVYSFGILLLEVICGRKFYEFQRDSDGITLASWLWKLREADRILEVLDPTLSDFQKDEVKRFIDVALMCIQSSPNLRPSMSEVLLMLLGPCDLSKKELSNPEQSLWSNYHDEVNSSNQGINPRESKMSLPSSGHRDSLNPASNRNPKELVSSSTFMSVPSHPASGSMSKATRGVETEIESDLDTHYSASEISSSELMETTLDLETELYTSVEENISTAAPVSGPSDKDAVKSKLVEPSSLSTSIRNPSFLRTNSHVHLEAIEAAEQTQLSHDIENEIQICESSSSEFLSGQTTAKDEGNLASSAEIYSFEQNEEVERISFQAETSETAEVLSLPKVDMNKPIQHTLKKILEVLKDAHHRRICLHGRGGSGKTTVLKNLFCHPETKKLFDHFLFVTVPRFAYKKHVQDEIVKHLSLNIEACSEDEIFCLIHQALIDRKFLLLLDNVWESINLHEIGIPSPSPENSCWVVLATKSLDVCRLMADTEIEMEVLSIAEAWEVFYCQVRDIIKFPEIEPYARAISKECYGSPLIISAIGCALRAESSVEEWEFALKCLQSGDTVSINDQCFFRRHIKYCYDRLKARDVKTCFLYTALFQEDREIYVSTLVEYFISEGLVSGKTRASYDKGHDIVGHLTNASLLEAYDNGLKVKMHNVVKDSALDILSSDVEGYHAFMRLPNSEKDESQSSQVSSCTFNSQLPITHKYLTRAGAHLKESPSMQEWEQATMIFLMDNELSSLPSKPECSALVALFLQRNSCLRVIPASFFDSMSTLKILNLSGTRITTLPDSFCGLSSLQILLLRDCKRLFVLPPSIGLLKSLKVLDLQGTEVTHLPDCVGELTSLEHLSISFYGSMNHSEYKRLPSKLVSDGIILSLGLRELGIFVYPGDRRWTLNASSITKEIINLKLSVLNFQFPKVEDLECFVHESHSWRSRSLTTFSIVVGNDFKRLVSLVPNDAEVLFNEGQRRLRFVNGVNITDSVVEVLTQATSFYLDHHLTITSLSQFGIYSFDSLKICILRDCPEFIEMVDREEQERNLFPVLENLSINNLWNLERVWVCPIAKGSPYSLRCLSVHACPKLRYVFTCSMLDSLSNLEELVIEDCVSLKYLVIGDDDVKKMKCVDAGFVSNKLELPMLRSLKVLKLHYLPKICGIWRGRWPFLEYISIYNCPQLRNLHMKVNDDVHIKEIAADKAWWDSLFWNDLELSKRLHKHLTQIHLDDL